MFAHSGHAGVLDTNPPAWQETAEVLERFDQNLVIARQQYESYLAEGVGIGKRPDLIGGGLLRSSRGWEHILSARRFGEHLKSDERILGDSDFVEEVLSGVHEKMDRTRLCRENGKDLAWLSQKVADLLKIDPAEIWKEGKRAKTVQGRRLLCYWAIRELGMTAEAVSKVVCLSESGVVRAAQRGEQLAAENDWRFD
jgi:putative transposase